MHLCKFVMKYVRAFLIEISLKMLFQFVSVSPAAHILEIARSLFNFEVDIFSTILFASRKKNLCHRMHEKVSEGTLRKRNFFLAQQIHR